MNFFCVQVSSSGNVLLSLVKQLPMLPIHFTIQAYHSSDVVVTTKIRIEVKIDFRERQRYFQTNIEETIK